MSDEQENNQGPFPTSMLNAGGQDNELQYLRAGRFFAEKKFDEANHISACLLSKPGVGDFHRAGAHLILAYSLENYVFHAQEALRLYKSLPTDTEAMSKHRDKWIEKATEVLEIALEDDANLTYEEDDDVVKEMLEKELDADIQALVDRLVEQEDEMALGDQLESSAMFEGSLKHEGISDSDSDSKIDGLDDGDLGDDDLGDDYMEMTGGGNSMATSKGISARTTLGLSRGVFTPVDSQEHKSQPH
ncbi:hypothetical protein Sste5346_009761 [Sporothrix stenoceras]|uniref:Uncharacterized protein n=1 Tax=Sporothrix stenoceras TaxID=5173 RepID=A0ABR3YIP9_9PEZI